MVMMMMVKMMRLNLREGNTKDLCSLDKQVS